MSPMSSVPGRCDGWVPPAWRPSPTCWKPVSPHRFFTVLHKLPKVLQETQLNVRTYRRRRRTAEDGHLTALLEGKSTTYVSRTERRQRAMIAFGLPALPHAISAADRTADAAPAPWDHHRCARRSRRGLDAVSGRPCAPDRRGPHRTRERARPGCRSRTRRTMPPAPRTGGGRACAGRTGRPGDEHRAHPASGWSSDGAGVIWTVLLSG